MLRVELIEVGNAIMVLVVGQHGGVEKLLVERPDDLPSGDLRTLERRFADWFAGKPIAEAQAIALRTAAESPGAEREMLLGVSDVLAHMQAGAGVPHRRRWRRQPRRRGRALASRDHAPVVRGARARVGDAAPPPRRDGRGHLGHDRDRAPGDGWVEASIVAAPFRAGETALGAIGVVGPTAMDYVSVMASVRAVARRLSELATELGA